MWIRKRILLLASIFFLAGLTVVLVSVNRAKRRARVPEMTLGVPPLKLYPYPTSPQSAVFLADSSHFITVDDLGRWFEVDLETGLLKHLGRWHSADQINAHNGEILAVQNGEFWRGHPKTGKWRQKTIAKTPAYKEKGYPARPAMAISPDGDSALVSTYYEREGPWKNGSLWLARTSDASLVWGGEITADKNGFLPVVRGRAFSQDGTMVAIAKHYLGALGVRGTLTTAARDAMSLDSQRLDIEIRRAQDGKLLRIISFPAPPYEVPINGDRLTHAIDLKFSPDGQTLAATANQIAYLFSLPDGALKATLPRSPELKVQLEFPISAFSSDGKILAICRGDIIELYETQTFTRLQIFYAAARLLAFSPDGKWLVSDNNTARLPYKPEIHIWEVGSLLQ